MNTKNLDPNKYSFKDWSEVDKTKLPKEAFFIVPDPEKKSTWKLPYKDETGKINVNGMKAVWGAIHGARTGKPMNIPPDIMTKIKKIYYEIFPEKKNETKKSLDEFMVDIIKSENNNQYSAFVKSIGNKISHKYYKRVPNPNYNGKNNRYIYFYNQQEYNEYKKTEKLSNQEKKETKGNFDKLPNYLEGLESYSPAPNHTYIYTKDWSMYVNDGQIIVLRVGDKLYLDEKYKDKSSEIKKYTQQFLGWNKDIIENKIKNGEIKIKKLNKF